MPQRLPRFTAQTERAKDAERLARVLLEVDQAPADPRPVNGAGGGDLRRLRGLPVVGIRGAGGTSPRTDPLRETLRRERQRGRM
jgi:hypothetical protein